MSIGEGLIQARREAGLSLAEVSQRTRIRERIIADIESDDYSACGGDFYARGHIRSIARAIGTDPEPFIREYDATQPDPGEPAEAEITQPGMAIGTRPGIPVRTEPGPPPRSQPGGPPGAEPGRPTPAEPGWPARSDPGWPQGTEPGWPERTQRGWPQGTEPGWPERTQRGWPGGAEPGWPEGTEPGWPARSDPGRPTRTDPRWPAGFEPGGPEGAEPDWPEGAEPGRGARTDPGFPFFAEPAPVGTRPGPPGGPRQQPPTTAPEGRRRYSLPPPPVPPGRTRRQRPLYWAALVALALLAGLGYLAYHVFTGSPRATSSAHSAPARPAPSQSAAPSSAAPTPSRSPKPTPRARPLAPAGAAALGVGGPGDDPADAHLAIDGNPGTAWHTDWYTSAAFGNLYAGTGLLVDMGRPVTITAARIRFGPARGGSFQLRVGRLPSLAGTRPAAHGAPAGVAQLRLARPARGRYVLIWLTRLPVDLSGSYRASVYDVRLQGR